MTSTQKITTKRENMMNDFPKNAYILVFKDAPLAEQFIKEGYKHVYCLADNVVTSSISGVKYYPYSLTTHFPDGMFDAVIYRSLSMDPLEIGQFLIEGHRIGNKGGKLITGLSRPYNTFSLKDKPMTKLLPQKVNIVCNSLGKGEGIDEYSHFLKKRFEQKGIEVRLVKWLREADKRFPIIFEYEPGVAQEIPEDPAVIIEAHFTNYANMFIEEIAYRVKLAVEKQSISYFFKEVIRFGELMLKHPEYFMNALNRSDSLVNRRLEKCRLLIRHPFLAQKSFINQYTLMPHIAYPEIPYNHKRKEFRIKLGTAGFAAESKNLDKICDLAVRLGVELVVLASCSPLNPRVNAMHHEYAETLKKDYGIYPNIHIKSGYFKPSEMLHELSDCTHIISAQNSSKGTSGSMRLPMQLGIPVISVPNFQAMEAGVYQKPLEDITTDYLRSIQKPTALDDGFPYLLRVLTSNTKTNMLTGK